MRGGASSRCIGPDFVESVLPGYRLRMTLGMSASLSGHSFLHRCLIGERFHRPNSELGVLVADRSALFISGRCESGLSLFQISKARITVRDFGGSPSIETFFPPRARYFPPPSVRAFPAIGEYSFKNASGLVTSISDHWKCWWLGLRV